MCFIKINRMDIKVLCILLCFACPVSLNAQGNGDTRIYELKKADEQLNNVYKKIYDKLTSKDQKQLRASQRIWLKFRDSDCSWAYNAEPLDCMIDRTENRAKELNNSLFQDKWGNYSSVDLF